MKCRKTGRYTWKALILAAAAAAFVLCAAGCGGGGGEAPPSPSPSISPTPSATPAVETLKVATVSNIEGSLNIRSAANMDSEILGETYAGDQFEVLTENFSTDWHEISYNGGKAYVYAEFVKVSQVEKSVWDAASTAGGNPDTASSEEPTATPDPDAPIVVNGSGRSDIESSDTSGGMTPESSRDTEDPERR